MAEADAEIAELAAALRDLQLAWERSGAQWRDHTREEFRRAYLEPLEQTITDAGKAMAHCASILARVQADCH